MPNQDLHVTDEEWERYSRQNVETFNSPAPTAGRSQPQGTEQDPQEPGERSLLGHAMHHASSLARAPLAGVARAVEGTVEAGAQAAGGLMRMTGADRLLGEEREEAFTEWYESGAQVDFMGEGLRGDDLGGGYQMIAGLSQFMAGFIPVARGLKGVAWAANRGVAVRAAMAGAASDGIVFGAYDDRLSNMAQELLPEHAQPALLGFFAADEDRGILSNRIRAAMEGMVLGTGMEALTYLARGGWVANQVRRGKLTRAEADARMTTIGEEFRVASDEAADKDLFRTTLNDDGTASVIVSDPEFRAPKAIREALEADGAEEVTTGVYRAKSPEEAEAYASALNLSHRISEARARKIGTAFKDEDIQRAVDLFGDESVSIRSVRDVTDILDLNHRYMGPEQATQFWEGIIGTAFRGRFRQALNRQREGLGQSHEETSLAARRILEMFENDEVLRGLDQDALAVDGLAERMLAYRMTFKSEAANLERIAQGFKMYPENGVWAKLFREQLLATASLQEKVAFTIGHVGRTLNQQRINVSESGESLSRASAERAARGGDAGEAGAPTKARKPGDEPKARESVEPEAPRDVESAAEIDRRLVEASKNMTRKELQDYARGIVVGADPDAVVRKMRYITRSGAEKAADPMTFWEKLTAFRINMLLSGATTQAVNAITSTANTFYKPYEYWMGGVLSGNREMREYGAKWMQEVTTLSLWNEGMGAWWKSFKHGSPILDARTFDDTRHATELVDRIRGVENPVLRVLAHTMVLPTRAMMATDEALKGITYHANVKAQAHVSVGRRLRDGSIKADEVGSHIDSFVRMQYDELALQGSGLDVSEGQRLLRGGALNAEALGRGREVNYQEALEHGIGKMLQDGANTEGATGFLVRTVFPFIRTPTNLMRFAWQRTPIIGAFQRDMRADIAAGGSRQALAASKQVNGLMFWSAGAALFSQGLITGGGPKDRQLREGFTANTQPYSVRVGDRWVSYRRLDPFGIPLGILADAMEAYDQLPDDDERSALGQAVIAAMAGASTNLTDKSYFTGFSDVLEALQGGERDMDAYLRRTAASFMPNFGRQAVASAPFGLNDPYIREVRSLVDEARARIPGLSETMEPRRNILGEPILNPTGRSAANFMGNPIQTMKADQDPLFLAFADLNRPFSKPAPTVSAGKISRDLRDRQYWDNDSGQSPYDRIQEIVQERGLRDALERLVASPGWDRLNSGDSVFPGGTKWEEANSVVKRFYDQAFTQVKAEYPKLREFLATADVNQQRVRGGLDRVTPNDLFNP